MRVTITFPAHKNGPKSAFSFAAETDNLATPQPRRVSEQKQSIGNTDWHWAVLSHTHTHKWRQRKGKSEFKSLF